MPCRVHSGQLLAGSKLLCADSAQHQAIFLHTCAANTDAYCASSRLSAGDAVCCPAAMPSVTALSMRFCAGSGWSVRVSLMTALRRYQKLRTPLG